MRNPLISCGIGILSVATWTVTAGEGASGHGAIHVGAGHRGMPGHTKPGGHMEQMGIFFPSELAHPFIDRLSGEPGPAPAHVSMPAGSVAAGGPEHMTEGHLVGPVTHPILHVAARVDLGDAANPQFTSANDAQTQQDDGATAQPNPPNASRMPTRPPGAAGPGRPVFGRSGPGLPGPGRPPSPRG
jgi:hypothetical protein